MKAKEKYDIFISYRREDGAVFAESMAYNLREQGYRVFFDKKELKIGLDFPYELEQTIVEAKEFIAIVTESYFGMGKSGIRINNNDDWIHKEVLFALSNSDINILPILVGTTAPVSDSIPENIKDVCSRNFYIYNNQYDTVEKIVDTLKNEFHSETIEHAVTGKIINAMNGVDVYDNKEFNVLCKKIINYMTSDIELTALRHILEYKHEETYYYDRDYRFVAFYVLFSYYRRMHYVNHLISLVEQYSEEFSEYNFFFYSMTEYYSLKFQLSSNDKDEIRYLEKMVEYAEVANEKINRNNGIVHSFCLAVAIAYEKGVEVGQSRLERAINMIESIIDDDSTYARYYSTKAKLLACVSNYDEALKNIRYAQVLERPDYNDWMLRISGYYKDECMIRIKQLEDKLEPNGN